MKALKVWLHGLTFGKQCTHGEDTMGEEFNSRIRQSIASS